MNSFAIPGQTPRPALDAAFEAAEEAYSPFSTCGVCGFHDRLRVGFGGSMFFDGKRMTAWMCPGCATAYAREHGI